MSKSIHWSGSWYEQGKQASMRETFESKGYKVLCDWTSPEHQAKSKVDQWEAITDAIRNADAVFFSFEDMEHRTQSATFAQFFQATFIRKPVVVYDPAKATREHRNRSGQPVHPAFSHLMGHPLYDHDNVAWVDKLDDAYAALAKFTA